MTGQDLRAAMQQTDEFKAFQTAHKEVLAEVEALEDELKKARTFLEDLKIKVHKELQAARAKVDDAVSAHGYGTHPHREAQKIAADVAEKERAVQVMTQRVKYSHNRLADVKTGSEDFGTTDWFGSFSNAEDVFKRYKGVLPQADDITERVIRVRTKMWGSEFVGTPKPGGSIYHARAFKTKLHEALAVPESERVTWGLQIGKNMPKKYKTAVVDPGMDWLQANVSRRALKGKVVTDEAIPEHIRKLTELKRSFGAKVDDHALKADPKADVPTFLTRHPTHGDPYKDRCFHSNRTVVMAKKGGSNTTDVFVHEVGHHMESMFREWHESSVRFLNHRWHTTTDASKKVVRKMSHWFPDYNYGPREVAFEDKFDHPYMGKVYGKPFSDDVPGEYTPIQIWATELSSMGMQEVFEHPAAFMESDPEYFEWVVNKMRGYWEAMP